MFDAAADFLEEDFFELLDEGSNAVYVTEADSGRFVYVNRRACEMTGYDRDELIGSYISKIDANLEQAIDWDELVEEMRDHPSFCIQSEHEHKNGSTFPVEVDNDLIELSNGTYVLAVVRNLSERLSKREKIVEHYDYYRELFKYSPVGLMELDTSEAVQFVQSYVEENNVELDQVFSTNPDLYWDVLERCEFLDMNDAALDLFQAESSEELLEHLPETITPKMKTNMEKAFLNMMKGNMRRTIEIRLKTLREEQRYALFNYMVPPSSRQDFTRVFISFVDITPRRKAQKELERSLKTKSTLLEEVHHRVKNNMQIIGSLLSTQARKIQSEEAQQAFENSVRRVKTMAMIHEKLYDMDQLGELNFEEFLNDLCLFLVDFHGDRIDNFSLELALDDVEFDLDTAIACGLILNELVSNSYKHGLDSVENGRIDIHFKTLEDNSTKLIVSDNGRGVKNDQTPLDETTAGWEILKALVEFELDGDLEITSQNGFKAEVNFEL